MRDARGTFHDAKVFALLNIFQRLLYLAFALWDKKVAVGKFEGFTTIRKVTEEERLELDLGLGETKLQR